MPTALHRPPVVEHYGLDLVQLHVLEVFSVVSRVYDIADARKALAYYPPTKAFNLNPKQCAILLKDLFQRNLLIEADDDEWKCPPEVGGDVVAHAILEGRLSWLLQLARQFSSPSWGLFSNSLRLPYAFEHHHPTWNHQLLQVLKFPESYNAILYGRDAALWEELCRRLYQLTPPGPILTYFERLHQARALPKNGQHLLGEVWLMQGRHQELKQLNVEVQVLQRFLAGDFAKTSKIPKSQRAELPTPVNAAVECLLELRPSTEALSSWQQVSGVGDWLSWFRAMREGNFRPRNLDFAPQLRTLGLLWVAAIAYWEHDPQLQAQLEQPLKDCQLQAEQAGYHGLAQLFGLAQQFQDLPWARLYSQEPLWRRSLTALQSFTNQDTNSTERLVWCIEGEAGGYSLIPRVQKRSKSGWTAGRSILYGGSPPSPCSKADKTVLDRLRSRDKELAWTALIGHPELYRQGRKVELAVGQARLEVTRQNGMVRLQLHPPHGGLIQEGPGRFVLVIPNAQTEKLGTILGDAGLELPEDEEEALRPVLGSIGTSLAISSDIALHTSVEERECDPTVYLRLVPLALGLQAQALVQPFGPDSPAYVAAQGPSTLVIRLHGRSLQTVRDLPREEQCLLALGLVGEGPWSFPDPLSSLEFLEGLQGERDFPLQVEWPEGEAFKIKNRASSSNFPVTIASQEDWFEVSGQLELDDGQVIQIQQLLEMMRTSTTRFLPLGNQQFLALTEELRQRLHSLANLLEPGRGKKLKIHSLAAQLLEDLPGLQSDQGFRDRLERMRKAQKFRAKVPSTLEAELRDYQRDGFQWLAQRARWGVGACLADDMGLGKTVQALALLLSMAPKGPSLVVAPTSVAGNWLSEAARFAPTLRFYDLRDCDRESLLQQVDCFDVVVVSYGLLIREAERLCSLHWNVVILDEAQAIKNSSSQRFRAACLLPADFRLAMTGTPVENRMDELWSLFRFLNPGLLGSLERFRKRFAQPIELGDRERRTQLRRLVHPFLLRRTKGQVLQELPARTEVTLEIELTPGERVFYEALRLRALQQLQESDNLEPIAVLAELTRLRRACCHPQLVKGGGELPKDCGSKLSALLELLEELKQGGHRVLVFSQFVDHLELIRQALERHGFSYQYLDGSTPAGERTRRVARFQAGEGDVFLISLKAGGVGINLTGADYVVHMDPWWNPAVEDQASDRAHRIGQTRPVTIYRLVARHTLENKIVALHAHKRELAEGLLEGANQASRLNADELLRLIREEA